MRLSLIRHPDCASAAVSGIEVDVARPRDGTLTLCYVVTGKISGLRVPAIVTPARADGLWQHTCFEAFITVPPNAGYYEFNFSPSTEWAAYRFGSYRAGMQAASEIDPPRIEISASAESYTLRAALDLNRVNFLQDSILQGTRGRLGLSAVIEETSGSRSYWALAHAPGKPDFHHADCFTHELS